MWPSRIRSLVWGAFERWSVPLSLDSRFLVDEHGPHEHDDALVVSVGCVEERPDGS